MWLFSEQNHIMFRHPFLIKEILETQYRCMLIASEMVAMEVSMDGFYSNKNKLFAPHSRLCTIFDFKSIRISNFTHAGKDVIKSSAMKVRYR